MAAGSPLVDKSGSLAKAIYPGSRVVGDATRNTSVASLVGRRLVTRAPVSWLPRALSLGGQLGRVVPVVGYGLAIYDLATFPWEQAFENYTIEGAYESVDRINTQMNEKMGTTSWSVFPRGPK